MVRVGPAFWLRCLRYECVTVQSSKQYFTISTLANHPTIQIAGNNFLSHQLREEEPNVVDVQAPVSKGWVMAESLVRLSGFSLSEDLT